jgi:RNA polymerase sigma-70 factor (ECF subfamily)
VASRAFLRDGRRHSGLEQLLVRSGRGDVAAFTELYDQLSPRVFGLVTSLVPDRAAAEAITCEAFVEAWRRAASFDPDRCSATAWVLVVAQRLALRAARA